MKITEDNNRIIINDINDFHPDHIFDNGQCFRWEREIDGSYTGVAFGKAANINYIDDNIIINNASLNDFNEYWKDYLDLERDYGIIKRKLSEKDSHMGKAISFGYGMRILGQDKWETLISFIISQNSNIPRIKKCIKALCANFGDPIGEYKGKVHYAFPELEKLAQIDTSDLDTCRLGYRADYIIKTAKKVALDGGETLNRLDKIPPQDALEYLLSLSGVGPKVANCITLFSMKKYDSFPLDVWIKRVMHQIYGIEEGNVKMMQNYAAEYFGEYGGIAQQYLFYYIREISKYSNTGRINHTC
ncbi:MAG: DNA glycosylase [Eubacteriales bacterium]|nr:DNA glycosylase [Eubacteriales bacterium]MDD3199672.1 DNA glycosylase [Eubacteriales bacterium]MDD4121342.1 DNA glycosylase [Eubacteriales bacterium]MDD4629813.1 DNA glycosylase [Eubacteriales bacterium]